jgi:hypothetical protein
MMNVAHRQSHFSQRCVERGIVSTDTDMLFAGIKWAVEEGRDDLVEKVLETEEARFFRFRCPDGIFYAVTPLDSGRAMTVLTQDMMRRKKWGAKAARGRKIPKKKPRRQ